MRELEKVRQMIANATQLDISYAYDDLVFAEHGIFIIQFDDLNPKQLFCHFNKDCYLEERQVMLQSLVKEAHAFGFKLEMQGLFELGQAKDKDEIEIMFIAAVHS
jgi:hypothetical protein